MKLPIAGPDLVEHPLAFHDHLAVVDRDPQVLAGRLAQHYDLVDFGPRFGSERNFLHRSSSAAAGELLLTAGYTTPIQGTMGERSGVGGITLCFAGRTSHEFDGRTMELRPDQPLFFTPGHSYRYSLDHFSGMAFDFSLDRLRATAAAMAGLGLSERRFNADLNHARVLHQSSPRITGLLGLLRREFALLDAWPAQPDNTWAHLPVDDLIYRTLTLLLLPRLAALLEQPEPGCVSGRERVFSELLEWIGANLHRPLALTELEQRSGYSRRSLQLAFHHRYGCGPIQWIRRQRLEQAREALLQASPDQNVSVIAARFGFSSPSAFSRDFRSAFGLTPSQLLREGKGASL